MGVGGSGPQSLSDSPFDVATSHASWHGCSYASRHLRHLGPCSDFCGDWSADLGFAGPVHYTIHTAAGGLGSPPGAGGLLMNDFAESRSPVPVSVRGINQNAFVPPINITGLAEVGRGFGVHRALWGPEPGPWAGGGGRYRTSGLQSFRRAATPRGGRGEGGGRLRQRLTASGTIIGLCHD